VLPKLKFALIAFAFAASGHVVMGQAQAPPGFLSDERVATGRAYAQTVCATCHLEPKPDLFSRETWKTGPIPWMAFVMGLAPELFRGDPEHKAILESGAVLTQPPLSTEEFGKIFAYYYKMAPEKNPALPSRPALKRTLPGFTPKPLAYRQREPMASAVRFDQRSGMLLVGDGLSHTIDLVDLKGNTVQSTLAARFPVKIDPTDEGVFVTCIGDFFPSQNATGKILFFPRKEGRLAPARTVLENLHRPSGARFADLNGDGIQDILVSMFGYYTGRLAWFEGSKEGKFLEHEIYPKPGTVLAEIRDLDGDGDLDVVALVAQAIEGLFFFINDGRGEFTERLIFQRHPAFGHTHFELVDFDQDGDMDVVTANGDIGDIPSPPRHFHGVRIYLNDGSLNFKERYFFPMHGATKAVPKDFDGDGDFDLAVTSYYPNFAKTPEEGFIYLENQGDWEFVPHVFEGASAGRWIAMEVADIDSDGDEDIVLGSVRRGPGRTAYVPAELNQRWLSEGVSLLLLENQSSKRK
jgi:hypothetical protein